MVTQILHQGDPNCVIRAGELLRAGSLVAIPTETVYGLAANALDDQAIPKIFSVKGRPQDNPLIVHISQITMWKALVQEIPPHALKLAEAFWPGPLTIILKKSALIPLVTSAGLDTVGVRMPAHPLARKIIEQAGVPLAAPSANLSGFPSPTEAAHCIQDLSGKIPLIVDGGPCTIGIESTVISLVDNIPIILRPGAITQQQIAQVLGEPVEMSASATEPLTENTAPPSPGMKYRHYSPKARIIIVAGDSDKFASFLSSTEPHSYALILEEDVQTCARPYIVYGAEGDSASQARGLFWSLRKLDELGATIVYARCPDTDGVGLGVYNRLLRAAGFEVVKL